MIYLSQLILNPDSRMVKNEYKNPYEVHRTIMQAFDPNRNQAGVLYRIESDSSTGVFTLLVQSRIEPDWQPLVEKSYLLPTASMSALDNPAVKQINLFLRAGKILNFRLRANPTIKKVRRDENNKRRHSNRVPLVYETKQLGWLQKRARDNGFCVLQAKISRGQKQTSFKKGNNRPITLYTVQFDGRLQVTDPDQLEMAVRNGIGPAKAFGCGLLSLAPG